MMCAYLLPTKTTNSALWTKVVRFVQPERYCCFRKQKTQNFVSVNPDFNHQSADWKFSKRKKNRICLFVLLVSSVKSAFHDLLLMKESKNYYNMWAFLNTVLMLCNKLLVKNGTHSLNQQSVKLDLTAREVVIIIYDAKTILLRRFSIACAKDSSMDSQVIFFNFPQIHTRTMFTEI